MREGKKSGTRLKKPVAANRLEEFTNEDYDRTLVTAQTAIGDEYGESHANRLGKMQRYADAYLGYRTRFDCGACTDRTPTEEDVSRLGSAAIAGLGKSEGALVLQRIRGMVDEALSSRLGRDRTD